MMIKDTPLDSARSLLLTTGETSADVELCLKSFEEFFGPVTIFLRKDVETNAGTTMRGKRKPYNQL